MRQLSRSKRPQLEAMQSFVREGDTVFCYSMDRLARNLDDLRRIVLGLTERGIHIVFVKENLTFTGEDSPISNLLLSVMGAFAQFERKLIRERQREGIAIAKREGKYSGRKPSLTPARAAELRRRVADGGSKAALAREFGISLDTLYRYVPVKKRRAGKLAK
ncbi:recombinase family protein [soil metagenome]